MSASTEIIYGIELRMPGEKLQNLGCFKFAYYCSQSTSWVFFHCVKEFFLNTSIEVGTCSNKWGECPFIKLENRSMFVCLFLFFFFYKTCVYTQTHTLNFS